MRTFTRKLLSLLLAFTMVCAMVPAALAADGDDVTGPTTEEGGSGNEGGGTGEGEGGDIQKPCDGEHTYDSEYQHNETGHWQVCTACGAKSPVVEHKVTSWTWKDSNSHTGTCSVCGADDATGSHRIVYTPGNVSGQHIAYCRICDNESSPAHGEPATCSDFDYTSNGDKTHKKVCWDCEQILAEKETCSNFKYKSLIDEQGNPTGSHAVLCQDCGGVIEASVACTFSYTQLNNSQHRQECNFCSYREVVDHEFDENGKCICGAEASGLILNKTSATLNGRNDYVDLWVSILTVNADGYGPEDVKWTVSKSGIVELEESKGEVRVYPLKNGTVTVTATLKTDVTTYTGTCAITVKNINSDISVEVTVFNTNPGYALGDTDDDGDDSVVDQIWDEIDDLTRRDEELDYVEFYSPVKYSGKGELDVSTSRTYYYEPSKSSQYDLSDVVFIPDEEYKGDVTFNFLAVDTAGDKYEGEITFKVEEGAASAGDIIYSAKNGQDVEFDVSDFEDFWEDTYSKGTLKYVVFDSVSSSKGSLVDADGDKVSSKKDYYVDPTSKQEDLDGITFEPKSNLKTAVTIDFTAYGTTSSSSSKASKSLGGTVVILYTEKEPEAIVYNSTGKNITLDADDFLDNYKDTVGSSASNIQIQFLDAPSNGTLYYNYNEKTGKGTELTSKNVQNYTFSTNTRASRSIEDVTYVPDSRGRTDTIKFACYTSSGELRYYGEVTFGQTVQNVSVSMTSTSAGVTFQTSSFTGADSAMLTVSSISFGTPSSGTLYKNWTGTSGTRVTASDMFSYVASVTGNPSLSTVTYVPVAGYSGNVTIPFSAYSATGNSIINGTVTIRVTATTTTTVFTDVPTTGSQAWAAPYISRLYNAGVVSGVTPTTYGPKQAVKWGEALKMVLRAAGYPAQTEGTGSNWAANYLTYAYNNGLVSSNSIDLNSNITRLEMAELAAKALKMSSASRINSGVVGPTDTTNGYVYALYNAGIVGGDSSSGQNRYNGGSSLNRDEMAKIVCGVMDYNG